MERGKKRNSRGARTCGGDLGEDLLVAGVKNNSIGRTKIIQAPMEGVKGFGQENCFTRMRGPGDL